MQSGQVGWAGQGQSSGRGERKLVGSRVKAATQCISSTPLRPKKRKGGMACISPVPVPHQFRRIGSATSKGKHTSVKSRGVKGVRWSGWERTIGRHLQAFSLPSGTLPPVTVCLLASAATLTEVPDKVDCVDRGTR